MTFSPRTWVVGETVTAAMLNAEIRDQIASMLDAWTPYTPVLGSSGTAPVLGNGTLVGRYLKIGRTVTMLSHLTVGSTTTFGSGNLNISIPAQSATVAGASPGIVDLTASRSTTPNFVMGRAPLPNGGTNTGTMWWPSTSTTGDWDAWVSGNPWSLSSGDNVRVYGTYQSAF